MFISIRSKLAIIAFFSLCFCAIMVFLFSINEHRDLYHQSVEGNLDALSANMADDLLFNLAGDSDDFEISAELLQFVRYPHIRHAKVYDPNWQLIHQYIRPSDLSNPDSVVQVDSSLFKSLPVGTSIIDETLVNLRVIGETQLPVGYLIVAQDYLNPLEESRLNFFRRASPFVLLTIIITIFTSWWLYQRFLDPLIQLSRFAREVGNSKNYKMEFAVEGNDEIAQLGTDINNLLTVIDRENKINIEQNMTLLKQRESMRRMAEFDLLTDLPNRSHFMKLLDSELKECGKNSTDLAVLFFDVDGFKAVNDSFGHEAGDELLIEVSQIVDSCLRPTDVLARLGGDEFLIMLPNIKSSKTSRLVAKRILEKLEDPLQINGWEIQSGVSIGIAHAKEAEYLKTQLIANADLAMYVSKENGKGKFTEFQQDMLAHSKRKLDIANSIAAALATNELTVHYQLKLSANGKVNGAEALARWTSPTLGFISPGEFIPIAEKSGNIHAITNWLIRQVFQDLGSLREICGKDFVVSLNISSHDLEDSNFINSIRGAIFEHNIDITKVQFEITESSYLDNFERANQFFNEIRQMGGTIALDDFGTGYSSLSYLTRICIDTLKVDRMFVSQMEESDSDEAILQTIFELARRLGLKTCSEGIETVEQASYLVGQGCDQLQGFLFAKPEPLKNLDANFIQRIEDNFKATISHNKDDQLDSA